MTPELTALVLAALLQIAQFALFSVLAQRQVGPKYAASPRDTPRQLTGYAGRAQRAMNNHFEGLILFTIAVVAVTYADQTSALTVLCAALGHGRRCVQIHFSEPPLKLLLTRTNVAFCPETLLDGR